MTDRLWGNTLGESEGLKTHATGTSGENRFDSDRRGKRWGPFSLEQRRGVVSVLKDDWEKERGQQRQGISKSWKWQRPVQ